MSNGWPNGGPGDKGDRGGPAPPLVRVGWGKVMTRENAAPEKVEVGPAVHEALEELGTGVAALDGALAVGLAAAGHNSLAILVQAVGKELDA